MVQKSAPDLFAVYDTMAGRQHHLVGGLLAHTVVSAISSHLLMVGQMPSPLLLFRARTEDWSECFTFGGAMA